MRFDQISWLLPSTPPRKTAEVLWFAHLLDVQEPHDGRICLPQEETSSASRLEPFCDWNASAHLTDRSEIPHRGPAILQ